MCVLASARVREQGKAHCPSCHLAYVVIYRLGLVHKTCFVEGACTESERVRAQKASDSVRTVTTVALCLLASFSSPITHSNQLSHSPILPSKSLLLRLKETCNKNRKPPPTVPHIPKDNYQSLLTTTPRVPFLSLKAEHSRRILLKFRTTTRSKMPNISSNITQEETIVEMETIQLGIIGMGDMGKLYARTLSAAGWKK